MEVQTCPHCGTRVLVGADESCPSCGRPIEAVTTQFSEKISASGEFQSASDPANPYAAPQGVDLESQLLTHETGGLLWMLFSFEGRVPRRCFWAVSLSMSAVFYGMAFLLATMFGHESPIVSIGILVMYPPIIWISLAVTIKRWHDRDKSGFWIFINLIPIIGPVWAFVETGCLRGTFGDNRFGPDPT